MATRFTEKALTVEVSEINKELAKSGSSLNFRVNPRNGYCAVDLCHVDGFGKNKCLYSPEIGTPRECSQTVSDLYHDFLGKIHLDSPATPVMAVTVLRNQMGFSKSFEDLEGDSLVMIHNWMKHFDQSSAPDFYSTLKKCFEKIEKHDEVSRKNESEANSGHTM